MTLNLREKFLAFIIFISLFLIVSSKIYAGLHSENGLMYIYGVSVSLVLLIMFTLVYFKYEDPYIALQNIKNKKKKKNPFVSCMVAVRNEEKVIESCILSFVNQTYKKREIIFVNDASTDDTAAVLDKYAAKKQIRVIHLNENVGKKKALGKAMAIAKGSIFAFSDSDSILAHDALEKIVEILKYNSDVGAVSGHCRALNSEKNLLTKIQDSWYEGQFSVHKAFESIFGAVTCVSGPLAVFRRIAVFNYVPAWENDTFLGQEFKFATDRMMTGFVLGSVDMGKKLKKKYRSSPFVLKEKHHIRDWKIVYCKSARAWTNVPDSFNKVLKQQIRWKKSFIRNIFFTGSFYWRKAFLPALFYYLHILFVLVGPFMVFRHLIYIPLKGNIYSAFLYIAGIIFIGLMFGLAYKIENKDCSLWMYRPLMSLFSTLILSWLIFYSILTIKKMVWFRG